MTDYNDREKDPLIETARKLQLEGKIEPKFLIIHFAIPKEDMDEILREKQQND